MLKKKWILIPAALLFAVLMASCTERHFSEKDGKYYFTVSGARWYMTFPSKNLELSIAPNNETGISSYMFKSKLENFTLTLVIKPAVVFNEASKYRDIDSEDVKYNYINAKNIIKYDYPECSLMEYFMPDYKENNTEYLNMDAYFIRDGFLINIHLASADSFGNKRGMFSHFIKTIKFEPRKAYKMPLRYRDSIAVVTEFYYVQGRHYSGKDNVEKAIEYYQNAFDIEMKIHTLDKYSWHVLIEDLAMCYGSIDDLEQCREILCYGLSKDPTFYYFYYCLAQAYAKTNNLDSCISNLKTAYKYKRRLADDENFPNVRENDVFNKYMNNSKFQQVLMEMGQ